MSGTLWTDDNDVAEYWCGGTPTWGAQRIGRDFEREERARAASNDLRWKDVPKIKRDLVRTAYEHGDRVQQGLPFTPPIRTNEPMAGDCGYEPGSLPPTLRWHPVARAFAAFVISGAVVYAALWLLPIVSGWLRHGR